MLELEVERQESPKSGLKHDLSLILVKTRPYITRDGKEYDIVSGSGIYVPKRQQIAEISFLSPKSLENGLHDHDIILREDEQKGSIYARYREVIAAYENIFRFIDDLEKKSINLKKACPEADYQLEKPVFVSVKSLGEYFHRFKHDTDTENRENYNSSDRIKKGFLQMMFLPKAALLFLNPNRLLLC